MPAAKRGEESDMGYFLVLEIVDGRMTARIVPPAPVMPALPRRTVAKVKRPVVVETTCEVVS